MPRIFDNIQDRLLPALAETMALSDRADFCVGYFNLRGWKSLDSYVERWSGGEGHCCRLLVGMHRLPQDQVHALVGLTQSDEQIDQATAIRLKKELVQQFKDQLTIGAPTNDDEIGLRRLVAQIKTEKLAVKLLPSMERHSQPR